MSEELELFGEELKEDFNPSIFFITSKRIALRVDWLCFNDMTHLKHTLTGMSYGANLATGVNYAIVAIWKGRIIAKRNFDNTPAERIAYLSKEFNELLNI